MGAASLAGSRRFSVGVGVGVDVVSLGGFQRAHFVFADISAVIELAGPVRLVSAIERVRLDGEALPGADVAAAVVLFPGAPVCAVAELSVTRYGSLGASVGSRIRFSKRISAVFGYDQNTGTLAAAIDVGVRSIAVDAGAFFHPVLGVSRSVFVRWGWWR